jgi:hypothetical protein
MRKRLSRLFVHTPCEIETTVATIVLEELMDRDAQTEAIRKMVLRTVSGWGVPDAERPSIRVCDVLRGGAAIGRKFEINGIRAIWLWDRDVVIFWGSEGQVLKTVSATETLSGRAQVA